MRSNQQILKELCIENALTEYRKDMRDSTYTEVQLVEVITSLKKQIAGTPKDQPVSTQLIHFLECFN